MPNVPVSEKCHKCFADQEAVTAHPSCDYTCSESQRVGRVFALCIRKERCRHVDACEKNPQTCGYWSDLTYPVEV